MISPISATLSPEDQQEVLAAIATIRERLPFLVSLTTEERQQLPKMGDKTRAFVQKALNVARQNPEILPQAFDFDEMERDFELFNAVQPLLLPVVQLHELLDDTLLAVGSESYVAALKVYNYTKVNGEVDGMDAAMEDLGQRFVKRRRRQSLSSASESME